MDPTTARCKFTLLSKTEVFGSAKQDDGTYKTAPVYELKFQAVTGTTEENEKFFAATPSGTFEVRFVRADMAARFNVGADYYLDISEA